MLKTHSAHDLLDAEFLGLRARLLEIGAALDRIDRGEGDVSADARRASIEQALSVLLRNQPNRAEAIQKIFSRSYDPNWRQQFGLAHPRHRES